MSVSNLINLSLFLIPFTFPFYEQKHREANLRLVAESSRIHRQTLGGPSSDPLSVLEGELERKINENSELHSKVAIYGGGALTADFLLPYKLVH